VAAALASVCFGLPPLAVQQVLDFTFHPALYLHPDRLKLHVPAAVAAMGMSEPLLSQTLQSTLGLGEEVALDLQDITHRAALLPAAVLQTLALRVGLCQQTQRIKRVILRSELTLLGAYFSAADWDFVFAQSTAGTESDVALPLDAHAMADWPAQLLQLGWRTLEAACSLLPDSVGKRWLLKFPLVSQPVHPSPAVSMAMVREIYPALVQQWNPGWDAGFLPATSCQ
jgi:hypothetical protein